MKIFKSKKSEGSEGIGIDNIAIYALGFTLGIMLLLGIYSILRLQ